MDYGASAIQTGQCRCCGIDQCAYGLLERVGSVGKCARDWLGLVTKDAYSTDTIAVQSVIRPVRNRACRILHAGIRLFYGSAVL